MKVLIHIFVIVVYIVNPKPNHMKEPITKCFKFCIALLLLLSTVSIEAQPYCNQPQGTAGFPSNFLCEFLICSDDPFCCETAWDGVCASTAAATPECNSCGLFCNVPQEGPGFSANPDCQAVVCADDPFCCETSWDAVCAESTSFYYQCYSCLGLIGCDDPAASNYVNGAVQIVDCEYIFCDQEQPGPGFSGNLECEAVICSSDPFCCDNQWDAFCAADAMFEPACQSCLTPVLGCTNPLALNYNPNATADNGSCLYSADVCCSTLGGINNFCPLTNCANDVCALDPFCCSTGWDSICASTAIETPSCNCPIPGCTNPLALNYNPAATVEDGSCTYDPELCCSSLGGSGIFCPLTDCANDVCAFDPFCCDTGWDGVCVSTAVVTPSCNCPIPGCTDPLASNYNPSATTDDGSCEFIFCDQSQGDSAKDGSPGFPSNPDCEAAVCATDPFCCSTSWDSICATGALLFEACESCWAIDACTGLNTFEYIDVSACDFYNIQDTDLTESGVYAFLLENAAGCNHVLTIDLIIVPSTAVTATELGGVITTAAGADEYQWFDCTTGLAIADENSNTYIAASSGSYKVQVTNGPCVVESDCIDVVITNVDEAFAAGNVGIYPNPSTGGFINVELSGMGQTNHEIVIQVFNISGKLVSQNAFGHAGDELNRVINFNSALATGLYIVNVNVDGAQFAVERLIVR
jgi:hypothetical protein